MDSDFMFVENYADDDLYDYIKGILISEERISDPHLIRRPYIRVYGKDCRQNRDVGFFSNVSVGYKYSNQIMKSQVLTEELESLLNKVNNEYNTEFNGILINHYVDGCDYIGKHRDDERGLDPNNSSVVSISLGAVRKFRIRDNNNKIVQDVLTSHGSLMMMKNNFQKKYTHEIPIEKKVKGERYSITFRHHKE